MKVFTEEQKKFIEQFSADTAGVKCVYEEFVPTANGEEPGMALLFYTNTQNSRVRCDNEQFCTIVAEHFDFPDWKVKLEGLIRHNLAFLRYGKNLLHLAKASSEPVDEELDMEAVAEAQAVNEELQAAIAEHNGFISEMALGIQMFHGKVYTSGLGYIGEDREALLSGKLSVFEECADPASLKAFSCGLITDDPSPELESLIIEFNRSGCQDNEIYDKIKELVRGHGIIPYWI